MAEKSYCNTWTGNRRFKIEKSSNYPFRVDEIKITTSQGVITDSLLYKSLLEIYIQNADGTKIMHKNLSMLTNNFIWEVNKELCKSQKLVIRSTNKIKRNYVISISGCELISESEAIDLPDNYSVVSDNADDFKVDANMQINDIDVSSDNPVNIIEKRFKATGYFSRPANTTAYTALDAITNSTVTPLLVTMDLSDYVEEGDTLYITNASISVSSKLTGAQINIWIFNNKPTPTIDNSELSIDDESIRNSIVIPCTNLYTTVNNSKIESGNFGCSFKLTGDSINVILQAASAFTPGNADRFDICIEGLVCR